MNQEERDLLSAAIDDELEGELLAKVSHRIHEEEAARKVLLRYRMIGGCLRGEEINLRGEELVLAVSRRLESEPTVLAPGRSSNRHRWLQPVAGAAIAASVAAVAVWLAPQFINAQKGPTATSSVTAQAQPADEAPTVMVPRPMLAVGQGQRWETVSDDEMGRFKPYLEQHSHYATRNGLQNVIPYTTLVSYGGAAIQGE